MSAPEARGQRLGARLPILVAALAGLAWAATLALLVGADLAAGPDLLSPRHLLFHGLAIGAGLLTFIPLERSLDLAGLTVEGTLGGWLLLACLAIVPAPTGSLLAPPDLPVYALLLLALFLSSAALARPLIAAAGRRLIALRAWALDGRRARRQSYEIGLLVAAAAGLAGLRALSWLTLLLLATAIAIGELLLLSAIRPGGDE